MTGSKCPFTGIYPDTCQTSARWGQSTWVMKPHGGWGRTARPLTSVSLGKEMVGGSPVEMTSERRSGLFDFALVCLCELVFKMGRWLGGLGAWAFGYFWSHCSLWE